MRVLVLALLLSAVAAPAAEAPRANGLLLVARPTLVDPNFRETVVLVTRHAGGGAVGVVLNRPTGLRLEEAFPDQTSLKGRPDVVFLGGPVSTGTLVTVFRAPGPEAKALRVLDDVWMTLDRDVVDRVLATGSREVRIHGGHAGWAPGQLEAEIAHGAWVVLDADAETIFRMDPQTMWRTLLRRASERAT
jgi:putative transcriptional regulator